MLKMQTAQGELLIEKGKGIYELVEKQADKEHIYAVIINGKLHDYAIAYKREEAFVLYMQKVKPDV